MNYVKKTCILRQIKQGFSGDGKQLTGLVKIEQYGKNVAIEVSVINFAALALGEYYCLIADPYGQTELLPLRGKSLFNLISELSIERGFCAIICFVHKEINPIAYGISGQDYYDIRALIDELSELPKPKQNPSTPAQNNDVAATNFVPCPVETPDLDEKTDYDDEKIAPSDYYERLWQNAMAQGEDDEREELCESKVDVSTEGELEKTDGKIGDDLAENADFEDVLHPIKIDGDGYYQSVKDELDLLFEKYPRDQTLKDAFLSCEWVRVKGDEQNPEYLVGVVYENLKAKYVCYALYGNMHHPPEEIKDVCTFIPRTLFDEEAGYFVIFQSAATGECIRPEKA